MLHFNQSQCPLGFPAMRHRKEISDFSPLSHFPSICQMASAVLFRRWQVRPQPPPHRTADGAAPPPLSLLFLSFPPSSPQLFVSPSHYSAPPPPPGTGDGYYTSRWRPGRGASSPLLKGRTSTPTPLAVQRVGKAAPSSYMYREAAIEREKEKSTECARRGGER